MRDLPRMPRPRSLGSCRVASELEPPADLAAHAPLLRALADETRLAILARLAVAEDAVCVCDLTSGLDLAQPTVSHHLKVLRDVGAVTSERRGTWIHYRPSPAILGALGALIAGLSPPARPAVALRAAERA